MRIDSIEISNLASLRGQQPLIDLRGEELGAADLIAVTGPTGAGKTTLFDAVCLALFNQTPRTRRRDPRELLARGAAEAAVAVGLTLDDGRAWRSEWSVHRARGHSEGQLQDIRQRIVDRATGMVVAEGKKAVKELVESALGLTFEQFSSVVLIAQGEFARFLEANDADRSALLEKLTGTEVYSELSRAAFERARAVQERLAAAEGGLAGLSLLDGAQRQALEDELGALGPALAELDADLERGRALLRWLRSWREIERARTQAAAEAADAEQALTDAASEQERWASAERAARAQGAAQAATVVEGRAQAVDRQLRSLAAELETAAEASRSQRAALGDLLRRLASALRATEREVAELSGAAILGDGALDGLRRAHQRHDQAAAAVQREEIALAEALSAGNALRERSEQAAERRQAAHADLSSASARLAELRVEESAIGDGRDRHAWADRRRALREALDLVAAVGRLDMASLEMAERSARTAERKAQGDLESARRALDEARADLRVHDELLRLAFQNQDIAQHRPLLEDGQPCPLCGSEDHPWAGRALEHEQSLRAQAEQRLVELRDRAVAAEMNAQRAAERHTVAHAVAGSSTARREQAQSQRQASDARWVELRMAELPELPLAPDLFQTDELAAIDARLERFEALAPRLKAASDAREMAEWRAVEADQVESLAAERVLAAGQRIAEARAELSAAEEMLIAARDAWRRLAEGLATGLLLPAPEQPDAAWAEALAARYATWQQAQGRRARLQGLDERMRRAVDDLAAPLEHSPGTYPDAAFDQAPGTSLEESLPSILEQELEEALRRTARRESDERLLADRLGRTQADAAATALELEGARKAFAAEIATHGFADADAWRAALLSALDVAALRQRLEELRRRRDRTGVQLESIEAQAAALARERPGIDTDMDGDELDGEALASAVADQERGKRAAEERHLALRLELGQDDARRRQVTELEAGVAELRVQAQRAARLNSLIGQKDGGKFRRFAQQLNLDQLLELANLRLDRLAPRYQLARLGDSLDLEVIDRDMADEKRPVSTLSGGESFLVSLALALALADLRRGKLALGTLFLDEGFGSLDEETLDTALSVLEQLQADQDTQILIISHVGALKERIDHRIDVRKLGGGRSRLSVHVR
jgi:exonuclease SbcC